MGNEPTKNTEANGNSNANEITVIQEFVQDHSDDIKLLLLMIVILLAIIVAQKLYRSNKKCIVKSNKPVQEP